ncbi:MAG: hypothetical protein H6834_06620 [Planctomycetes bacterium]|nr:hypothetical protein [Planctomycetota bacterium]MCB9891809.1 hypothetical protein [Planctomycetota bacterium]
MSKPIAGRLHVLVRCSLALALGVGTAEAQLPNVVISLCDGLPPQGYAYCVCEQTTPLVWEWVCFDEKNEGDELPPTSTDEQRERITVALVPLDDGLPGLNALAVELAPPNLFQPAIRILRGADLDGNGVIEDPERFVFSDATGLFPSGKVFDVCLDHIDLRAGAPIDRLFTYFAVQGRGLVQAFDIDGNGTALGPGETMPALVASSPRTFLHGAFPSAQLSVGALERLAATRGSGSRARVMAWAANDQCVYEFVDLNQDGDFDDASERRSLFYAAGVPTGGGQFAPVDGRFALNADVAQGVLPSVYDTVRGEAELDALAFAETSVGRTYYVASTLPARAGAGSRHGYVFRGVDANQNGTLNDAGEVDLFYDPRATGAAFERVLDVAALGDDVFVLQLPAVGAFPEVWWLRDLDGDGTAMSLPAEAQRFRTWRKLSPLPTELEVRPVGTSEPKSLAISYGAGCQGSQGTPVLALRNGAPGIGGPSMTFGMNHLVTGAPAALSFGFTRETSPFGQLPFDLTPFGFQGCDLLIDRIGAFGAAASTQGQASWTIPNPNDPALIGFFVYLQAAAIDLLPSSAPVVFSNGMFLRFDL